MFQWNEDKNASNIQKHGIDFVDAVQIFDEPHLLVPSKYAAEERWIAIGLLSNKEIAVIHMYRGAVTRIISARRARRNERKQYHNYLARGGPES
ncbi:MAG: BrnT family toxin [Pseudomonadota bacterium]